MTPEDLQASLQRIKHEEACVKWVQSLKHSSPSLRPENCVTLWHFAERTESPDVFANAFLSSSNHDNWSIESFYRGWKAGELNAMGHLN